MGFEKPRDHVAALKKLEGFPLMGIEVRDGRLVFSILSRQVSLPLHEVRGGGYKVARYGLNKLDVLVREVEYNDQSGCVRLLDEDGRAVISVELAQPTDPLPVYVNALKDALIGFRVQSVTVSDSGLCLHLDDDYDAVMNGALRVRVDSERVPFTVGDVFVNRVGIDFTLCICSQTESKPVVAFKIDRDTLDGKEMAINVI